MKKSFSKSKTFQEGDEVSAPFEFVDSLIWAYTEQTTPRDPAGIEHRLSCKVKITIEIFSQELCEGDFDMSTSKD